MRTTIDIPDPMYRRLKARASAEGRSVEAVLLDAAEHVLSGSESAPRRAVRRPLVKSKRPGSLRLDNAAIYDIISFP